MLALLIVSPLLVLWIRNLACCYSLEPPLESLVWDERASYHKPMGGSQLESRTWKLSENPLASSNRQAPYMYININVYILFYFFGLLWHQRRVLIAKYRWWCLFYWAAAASTFRHRTRVSTSLEGVVTWVFGKRNARQNLFAIWAGRKLSTNFAQLNPTDCINRNRDSAIVLACNTPYINPTLAYHPLSPWFVPRSLAPPPCTVRK